MKRLLLSLLLCRALAGFSTEARSESDPLVAKEQAEAQKVQFELLLSNDSALASGGVCDTDGRLVHTLWTMAGRFHRSPKPANLVLALRNMPSGLKCRLYDLKAQRVVLQTAVAKDKALEISATDHDYLCLITPEKLYRPTLGFTDIQSEISIV